MNADAKTLHLPSSASALPRGWSWIRLEEGCLGIFDCPHSTPQLATDGPLMARSQDIRGGMFRVEQAAKVDLTTYRERIRRAEPSHGDLFYSREGTYFGIAAEVPPDLRVCLGQRMVLLRPDPRRLYFRYLRYWLNSPILASHVVGFRDGTVAERLNLPTIRALPVLTPPLEEQKAIAHILGTLDDKIELKRRMNQTLEAMARALFKSWFVDFDPVRAKAEGRTPPGLDPATAALFPDRFVDTEIGEIPKGWNVRNLYDFSLLNLESWTKSTRPKNIDYVDLSNTKWGRIEEVQAYAATDAPSRAQRVLRPQDTIVGTVRPGNGAYALVLRDGLTGSTGFAVLRPLKPEYTEFVYLAATAADNIERLAHLADGGAYPAVRPEVVATSPAIGAPDSVLTAFSRLTGPLLTQLEANNCEAAICKTLRDTLLPKLLSGELCLRVRPGGGG